jgi:DNA invertase Pin-like site-specific DNA recombinase
MRVGYARVSGSGQSLDIQVAKLREAGCDPIRSEKVSGKSREGRDELANIMDFVGQNDEVVVCRLDRLGRSTRDALNLVYELDQKGASLRILEPAVSTGDQLTGRLMITVLGMVADLELEFLTERRRAGIRAKKEADKHLKPEDRTYRGRRRAPKMARVAGLRAEGKGPTEIARALGVTRMTVYREFARLDAASQAAA